MNVIHLIGRFGQDPELRQVGDTQCLNISIATSRRWTDKNGERKEETDWHRLTFWGKQAELVAEYFKKGDMIGITGSMHYRKYEDNNGVERTSADVRVSDFYFVGNKSESSAAGGGSNDYQRASQGGTRRAAEAPKPRPQPASRQVKQQPAFDDDDIPF